MSFYGIIATNSSQKILDRLFKIYFSKKYRIKNLFHSIAKQFHKSKFENNAKNHTDFFFFK